MGCDAAMGQDDGMEDDGLDGHSCGSTGVPAG
jgi:hypothetical protein